MTNSLHDRDSEVGSLLADRARYEAWLRALEQRRESTPPHIYQRVHADYSGRLQQVFDQLGKHRAAIEQMIGELDEQLAALEAEENRYRDERAEAELRAMIGEYAEERCADVVRRTDQSLARVAEEKGRLAAEIARLQAVVEGAPAAAALAPRAQGAAPPVEDPIVLDEDPLAEENQPETPSAPAPAGDQRGWAPGAGTPGETFDELEFLKNVVAPGQEGARSENVVSSERQRPDTPAEVDPAEGMRPFLQTTPAEQVKTLRCQECKTMNYPTEWYCERCGAELAAL